MIADRSVLPPDLLESLSRLNLRSKRGPSKRALDAILDGLSTLSPHLVVGVYGEIVDIERGVWSKQSLHPLAPRLLVRDSAELDLLKKKPNFAWLFLFHPDGYVREAALEAINTPPASPFFFAALALRLNDWAAPVRAAAERCFARVLARISPAVIADTARFLLDRRLVWGRWSGEDRTLDRVFERPDVADQLAVRLREGTVGPLAACLQQALRYPSIDGHLQRVATEAVQPHVRRLALKCLIEGQAEWLTGFTWVWTDKVYGRRKQVPVFASRQLDCTRPTASELIRNGIVDRSSAVRIVAADALVKLRDQIPDAKALALRLVNDRTPAVRLRGAYLQEQP